MSIFNWGKTEPIIKATGSSSDVIERENIKDGIHKAYMPLQLYKPPYGYPRAINIPLVKQLARNPYIHAVINMLQEEAASNKWEIVPKDKETEIDDTKVKLATDFLCNPNGNKEGFSYIVKAVVRDISEVDAGVWVKVFNLAEEMVEIYARDGGYFLKNPDMFGYMGDRQDIIYVDPSTSRQINEAKTRSLILEEGNNLERVFDTRYKEQAAYFQYGFTNSRYPVPFGKREVVYFTKNPRSESIYGISPVQILADVILTLVYGSQYNLDFYMNSNIPDGILQMIGANSQEIKGFKSKFESSFTTRDPLTGFMRKIGFKMPVTNVETKFTPFQLPSKELQIIEQQEWFTKVVWMAFGITADDLGFTENSNKAVSQTMEKRFAKKAVRPILNLISERINMEILPEFGLTDYEFKWDDYDLDEDIKRHSLYEMQIRMGIKTPEMVAEEEHIDIVELKVQKEEQEAKDAEKFDREAAANGFGGQTGGFPDKKEDVKKDIKKDKKPGVKADVDPFITDFEKELLTQITDKTTRVMKALKRGDVKVKKNALQS